MENAPRSFLWKRTLALGILAAAISVLLAGCGAPGEPIERKTPVPAAVTDLSVSQAGNDVVLSFTLPTEAQDRRTLKQTPAIEIYRGVDGALAPPAGGSASSSLVVAIPPAMVPQYLSQGRIRYSDSLSAADFAQSSPSTLHYIVRTSESQKTSSTASNTATLQVYPAPVPIDDVKTQTVQSIVVLTWTPPQKTIVGSLPQVSLYRIYRAEVDPGVAPSDENVKLKTPLARIGESDSATFGDMQAALGTPYVYSVRSVMQYSGIALESSDSNFAIITPRDVLPPETPQNLLVVYVPQQADAPAHFELSWMISAEPDVAGYNVYRSDSQDTRGARLNPETLLTPVFRDISVTPGKTYYYSVTAVDRSGNESPASDVVFGNLPAQNAP